MIKKNLFLAGMVVITITLAGCASKPVPPESSNLNQTNTHQSVSSQNINSDVSQSIKSQNNSDWVVYVNINDDYNLYKIKKDGTENGIIIKDSASAPCMVGDWVYYLAGLNEVDKVKLDGSQKTKVCDTDAMRALNANVDPSAQYKDGSILYKLIQLREVGDDSPNTVTYYKLDINQKKITEVKNLPVLTVPSNDSSMNLESYYLAQDISELENGNPWTKNTKLNVLPVFNNTAYFDSSILPQDVEYARRRMTYDAEQAANALDMKVTNEKVEGNIQSVSGINGNDDYQVTVTMANGEIVVKFNSTVITFNEGVKLPEKYKFTAMKTSKKDAESVADYLAKRFSKLLSLSAPFSSIKSHKALCAGYTNDGNIQMDYGVFDASGNITNQILNFNFYKTHFVPDNVGNLKIINIDNGLLCYDKTGDYPIITSDEAFRLLLNGNYFTSVSEKMPGEKYVRKVELLYATGDTVKTFMPVYCYWVELPDKNQANGFKTYGAYYVPAVEQKYITNMPLWDGGTD